MYIYSRTAQYKKKLSFPISIQQTAGKQQFKYDYIYRTDARVLRLAD